LGLEFRPSELIGALVVDSEGYIYGHVVKVDIKPEGAFLKIKSLKSVKEQVPDIEVLKQTLLKECGLSNVQELYKFIANELKIQSITENDLINYAKLKEVKIPLREVLREVEEEKPDIQLSDVEAMNKSDLGSCILVKNPIESEIRGIEPKKTVLYQKEESLKGKLVIDNSAKILGKVHGILMSPEGLSIQVCKEMMVTKLVPDINKLKKRIFSERKPKDLIKHMEFLGFEQPQDLTDDKIVAYAKMRGYDIPTNLVSSNAIFLYKSSVPWHQIRKIGDVVILNKTLLEVFVEESKKEEPMKIYSKEQKPSVQAREYSFQIGQGSFAYGAYIGTLSMILFGLLPYIGALFSGGVAGYIVKEWKRGALAGLLSGFLGTLIIAIILHLLLPIGLKDFLTISLPSSILNPTIEMLDYAVSEMFLYFQSLLNASIGFIGGLFLGFLKSKS
jgi:sporulation protein YlmC with PRC-barrel domain